MSETGKFNGLTSMAAWGDWKPGVPKGCVVLSADSELGVKYFIVPASEYVGKAMVIDSQRYPEAKGFVPFDRSGFASPGRTSDNPEGTSVADVPSLPRGAARPWSQIWKEFGCLKGAPGSGFKRCG